MSRSERELYLHNAICSAVSCMNMGGFRDAHDLLQRTLHIYSADVVRHPLAKDDATQDAVPSPTIRQLQQTVGHSHQLD